jgi:hypothetical protein
MTNPHLPGYWAAAMALNGQAGEAQAILTLMEGREEGYARGEMALSAAFAHAALGDAGAAVRWLGRDLGHVARLRPPHALAARLDWLEKAHVLRGVSGDAAFGELLSEWRALAREAAEAGRRVTLDEPSLFGDFGDLEDLPVTVHGGDGGADAE